MVKVHFNGILREQLYIDTITNRYVTGSVGVSWELWEYSHKLLAFCKGNTPGGLQQQMISGRGFLQAF